MVSTPAFTAFSAIAFPTIFAASALLRPEVSMSLSLDDAAVIVFPLTSSIIWAYISLLLRKTAKRGRLSVPSTVFLILMRRRALLSYFDNAIFLDIRF